MLIPPEPQQPIAWTMVSPDTWSAVLADGTLLGSVTRTDRYAATSTDRTVNGTHRSLDSACSQIEAHGRWLHAHPAE